MSINRLEVNNIANIERTKLEPKNAAARKSSVFLEDAPEEQAPKEAYFRTKAGFILHIKYNSERLESDGHSRSYFDIECFDTEGNKLNNQEMCDELGFKLTKDYIDFNGLISFKGKVLTIKIPGKALTQTPANKAQIETASMFSDRINQAQEAFDNQLKEDGFAGNIADGVSMLWNSDNQACKVKEDLRITNKQLKELQRALEEGDQAFRTKFKEIFGVEFNENSINSFKEVEKMYLEASENKTQEDYFKNEFSLLLNNKPLSDEKLGRDSNGEEWRLSKQDVYEREYKKLAKFTGKEALSQLIKQSVGEDANVEIKYLVLQSFAQITLKSLNDKTRAAGGGRDFEELQSLYNNSYKNAFGENDILKRVYDYNKSQQEGAGVVKSVTITAATIAAGFLSGGLAIPLTTGFATMGTEVLDRATSGEALETFKKEGVVSWLEKVGETTDWNSVVTASVSSAAMSVMFMGQSYNVTKLCLDSGKSLTTAMVADLVTGTATGAGVEYLMNGEISVEGQIFSVAMSILGGAVSIKSIKKTCQTQEAQPQKPGFGLQEPPKRVMHADEQINHVNLPDEGIPNTVNGTNKKPQVQVKPKGTPLENALHNADLSNETVQKQLLEIMDKELPSTRKAPGRLKTLREMQTLINSSEYLRMSPEQQQIAKIILIKSNPRIDPRVIFDDINLSSAVKNRLKTIDDCVNLQDPNIAAALYHEGDFKTVIAILKAKGSLDETMFNQLKTAYNNAQQNGCLLVNNTTVNPDNFPEMNIMVDGKSYSIRVLDCTNPETFQSPELFGLPAGTTKDNMRLTVHVNDGINSNPQQTLGRMRLENNLNLSASITDGKNALYGNQNVGIVLDYDMGSVSYASNYAAGTGFCKDSQAFANAKLNFKEPSHATFARERFIEHMKSQGYDISVEDYAAFSRQFQSKNNISQELKNISKNNIIEVNGKPVKLDHIQKALFDSSEDMMKISYEMRGKTVDNGFNEINVYQPEIKTLYVRANSVDETLETLLSPRLLEYLQKRNIPIVFQRQP